MDSMSLVPYKRIKITKYQHGLLLENVYLRELIEIGNNNFIAMGPNLAVNFLSTYISVH